ncbi:MAG: ornithine cyclodeaminase family protein [Verrucomicrobia bacterium]|nr:ornithine cyclodeaminase family protein [Verrucomicrobiota bacterium]
MRFIDRAEVARRLTYPCCIALVRDAMVAFSTGETRQLLRSILPLSDGRLFGVMPGALSAQGAFGAKLISVFHGNAERGRQSHQGVVVLFDGESGEPVCLLHAGEITAIRTGAASAVATAALARPEAARLAILGCGEQALSHARALVVVRPIREIALWGRSLPKAQDLARRLAAELARPVLAHADAREAVAEADVICTVTSASEPILQSAWVRPGTHINVVGSSHAGPVEVDHDLVVRARFFADSREGVLRQGAEFLRAKEAGLMDDAHLAGEIGEVLAGRVGGRRNAQEVTIYKSLGHIAQDLASAWWLYRSEE